jgi:haloalkane dehalogenase
MKKKVLLSSVCQPFGEKYGDGFGTSYEGSHQLLWAQGVFKPRATTTQWGLDFIAANLKTPTTTLHYPTMNKFVAELRKGYDFVGIAFVAPTMHKMVPMAEAVRRYAPQSKIVLGGYGTAIADEPLESYGDYICKGEGVAFMRGILGEPVDSPFQQPLITQQQYLFSVPIGGRLGYVFAGLGCPNGCDFCATSHFFKRRHIRLLPNGGAILGAIKHLRRHYPDMVDFYISDEDFLLNEARGREFLAAIRESDLPPLSLSIFSSVKALSQFEPSELVEMGIDLIWVGFEGKRAGFSKMDGRPYGELFADLRHHGISVIASMIIGFDYQTPEIVQEEFDELMSMCPTVGQFLIYGAPYGTPLFKRLSEEGRLKPEVYADKSKHDGFTLAFDHPHIGSEEMASLQKRLYQEEFKQLGPSAFRTVENWLSGHVNLRDHAAPRVRAKAQRYGKEAHRAQMVIPASKKYLNADVVAQLEALQVRLAAETGPLTLRERIRSRIAPALLWYTDFKIRNDIGQQPTFTRRSFKGVGVQGKDEIPSPLSPFVTGATEVE